MKVLIAVDDSEESQDAVRKGFEVFGPDAEYTICAVGQVPRVVWHGPLGSGVMPAGQLADQMADSQASAVEASEAATDALPPTVDVEVEVETGDAGARICAMAIEREADVIVIGSHDRSRWERLFTNSVGRYLIENGPCPVLVVRGDLATS